MGIGVRGALGSHTGGKNQWIPEGSEGWESPWDVGMLDHLQVLRGHLSLLYPSPGARASLGKEPLPPAAPSPGFGSNLTAGFEMPAELRGAD